MSVQDARGNPPSRAPRPRLSQRRRYLLIAIVGALVIAAGLWVIDNQGRLWQMATGFRQPDAALVTPPDQPGGSRDRAFEHRAIEPKQD